jgi:hypothetical protein
MVLMATPGRRILDFFTGMIRRTHRTRSFPSPPSSWFAMRRAGYGVPATSAELFGAGTSITSGSSTSPSGDSPNS